MQQPIVQLFEREYNEMRIQETNTYRDYDEEMSCLGCSGECTHAGTYASQINSAIRGGLS